MKGVDGIGFLTDVIQVSAGSSHSMALKSNGDVYVWGNHSSGQLGTGPTGNQEYPFHLSSLSNVKKIQAAMYHSIVLKHDGTVWAWGNKSNIGCGSLLENSDIPLQEPGFEGIGYLSNIIDLVSQGGHNLMIKYDGTVWGSG